MCRWKVKVNGVFNKITCPDSVDGSSQMFGGSKWLFKQLVKEKQVSAKENIMIWIEVGDANGKQIGYRSEMRIKFK